ncbi:helix-turn-helix domain-containing protein [Natrinema ejinorense]|uniref:Bacterio-opsin activator n=1 Tax=Natrinema ejinorense TaxID=373386 RepID=A0A2A5QV33_9EURY|nr:helix-turn-helix domain-containing protein [Natrinema ejinorense]PCR90609.1 bacterio-opsin activator [Natrinema ejinorense]
MSESSAELLQVTVDVWHPDCWGIVSTDRTGTGIVGHGAAIDGDSGYERCTLYGDTTDQLEQAIAVADELSFIRTIHPFESAADAIRPVMGQSTQDVFIEYDANEGIGSAVLSHGFVLDSSYRIEDGIETWTLLVYTTRSSVERSLDEIRRARDADISLEHLSTAERTMAPTSPPDRRERRLTPRQREALAVARRRGYYEWPRRVSAGDLATDLGVSKSTYLEHLRKAEAELLGRHPFDD